MIPVERPKAAVDRHLLLKVRPLKLREVLSKYIVLRQHLDERLFERVYLEFAPGIYLRLKPSDREHKRMTIQGFTELSVSRRIWKLARRGGLMVDVGANYGYYACIWAAGNVRNSVVAFEPSPLNIEPLRANIKSNGLDPQVNIRTEAVGLSNDLGHFWVGPREETGWGGLSLTATPDSVKVKIVSLDQALPNAVITVLKIDTEGADTWVLIGAQRLLAERRIVHVFFEDNPERRQALGIQCSAAHNLLKSFGYNVEYLGDGQYHATISRLSARRQLPPNGG
jgi:FkbM family methyltransferase